MGRKKRHILVSLAMLFAGIYLLAESIGIWRYGSRDETVRADVAVVLGAATEQGEVSPVYQARLDHAILLYRQGYVDKMIVTGGTGSGNAISDAAAAKGYVVSQGILETDIYVEEQSRITQESLENAGQIMDRLGMRTALIVSDPLHMKRAMRMADDLGISAHSSPTGTTMYRSLRTKIPFLAREVFFYEGYKLWHLFMRAADWI